jgi:hypothetical protein
VRPLGEVCETTPDGIVHVRGTAGHDAAWAAATVLRLVEEVRRSGRGAAPVLIHMPRSGGVSAGARRVYFDAIRSVPEIGRVAYVGGGALPRAISRVLARAREPRGSVRMFRDELAAVAWLLEEAVEEVAVQPVEPSRAR